MASSSQSEAIGKDTERMLTPQDQPLDGLGSNQVEGTSHETTKGLVDKAVREPVHGIPSHSVQISPSPQDPPQRPNIESSIPTTQNPPLNEQPLGEADTNQAVINDQSTIRIDDDDADSAIGADSQSDTITLKSSITAYRVENGRRYHAYKEGAYWGPNDDLQSEQLDIAHHLHTLILDGKLHLAPVGELSEKVLDLGTGTGIWAIDFANQYPSATVIGTDISPIQPSWVPPNVSFEIEDFTDDWTFKPNEFDYIHVCCLYGCVGDWPKFYRQVYKHLKPGEWMEQLEVSIVLRSDDGSLLPNSALARFGPLFLEAANMFGKTLHIAEEMKGYIDAAGLVNTVERVWKAPIRGWAADPKIKELGHWGLLELEVGLEGFAMALLTRVMGWKFTEVQAYLGQVRTELRSRHIHTYHYVHAVYGQKPL